MNSLSAPQKDGNPAGPYRFTQVKALDEARQYQQAWNDLAARSEFQSIYSTWEFFEAWWLAFGSGRTLHLTFGYDSAGTLRLVAPCYEEQQTPRILFVVGHRRADYCQIVTERGDADVLRGWLRHMRTLANWEQIHITRDPGSGLLGALAFHYGPESGAKEKLRAWAAVRQPLAWASTQPTHPYIDRANFGEHADLMQRRSHKKHLNWFSRQGTVSFRSIKDPVEIGRLLPMFFDLHLREWAARGQQSMFTAASNRNFYDLLTQRFAPLDAVSLDVMLLDGKMIAGHYGFEWATRFYYLKPCFDPDYHSQSPGKLLLAYLLQQLSTRDVSTFDFLNGLEDYKFKYTRDVKATTSIIITRSRLWRLNQAIDRRGSRQTPTSFE